MIDNKVLTAALEELPFGAIICKVHGTDIIPLHANEKAKRHGLDLDDKKTVDISYQRHASDSVGHNID